jgi:hypothetical protein
LLVAGAAWADEASKKAKVEEMLRLSNTEQMLKQTLSQMQAMQAQEAARMAPPGAKAEGQEVQNRLMKLIQDRLSWEKLKPAFVQLYADTYTDEELDGIVGFYKSPAGRAFLEKMPVLVNKTMKLTQDMMGDLTPEIRRMAEDAAKEKK